MVSIKVNGIKTVCPFQTYNNKVNNERYCVIYKSEFFTDKFVINAKADLIQKELD